MKGTIPLLIQILSKSETEKQPVRVLRKKKSDKNGLHVPLTEFTVGNSIPDTCSAVSIVKFSF